VQTRRVELGSQVHACIALASLVGTDQYRVEASVPLDELRWIQIPGYNAETGSPARVYHDSAWGAGAFREGRVQRLRADLEPQGRMARLLIGVRDPLHLEVEPAQAHPLILDSYVRLEIEGRTLPDVIEVPRTALRDGNRVWIMGPENALLIRELEPAWSGDGKVYVSEGLSDGDLLVTSDLAAPVEGMALRTADAGQPRQRTGGGESE
jgi:hypothetical protein